MQEFAFIFRPSRPLKPEELAPRNAAAREWALARRSEGVLVFPAPLESDGFKVTQDHLTKLEDEQARRSEAEEGGDAVSSPRHVHRGREDEQARRSEAEEGGDAASSPRHVHRGREDEKAVGAVLIIQAKDMEAALALAKSHPGLAYGIELEVRPLKALGPLP